MTSSTLGRVAPRTALLCLVTVLLAGCGPSGEEQPRTVAPPPQVADGPRKPMTLEVAPGHALEYPISPGETHVFLLELAAGDYFEVQVEQRGVDVGLKLFAGPEEPMSDEEPLLEMDLPIADLGREPLLGVAEQDGSYRLEVNAWETEDDGDSYRIQFMARRPADDLDRLRATAARTFQRADYLYWSRQHRQALASYQEALALWRQAEDDFWQAETLDWIGTIYRELGDRTRAAEAHAAALASFERQGELPFAAVSSHHLATDYSEMGELELAAGQHLATLELRRRLDDRRGRGISLGALANIYKVRGETQKALDSFAEALELLDAPEDRGYRAFQLHNLGTLYRRMGNAESALQRLREAEQVFRDLGDIVSQAASLSQIGQLEFEAGDARLALQDLGRALELRRRSRNKRGEAVALRGIGAVLRSEGDLEGAMSHHLQALELLRDLESPRSEAALLTELGALFHELGQSEEALDHHRRALEIYERVGDLAGTTEGLLGVALANRQRGRMEMALEAGERALEIAEALRLKPLSEELRFSFFSTAQRLFDFYIDLLMQLERADPGSGHAARALHANERARARSLLDLLSEAGAEIRDDTAPGLVEQEREMQSLVNRSVALLEDETAGHAEQAAATREVRRALDRLETVRAAIRRQSPRYADLTQPRTLEAEQIQRLMADPDTALLEYRLGRERSFLWLVTNDSLASFELAPADEIEDSVRSLHDLLQHGPRRETEGRVRFGLCELSRELLGPVAGRLGDKRLAIVADGALQYLPFAALPEPLGPCAGAEPLVVRHEIVYLPSASTLAVLRREEQGRESPTGTVAVLADPVFSLDDDRVTGGSGSAEVLSPAQVAALRGNEDQASRTFRRLPHSRDEAEAILELVEPELAFKALDFDASKRTVRSGRLAGYRIVHFATHGVLNAHQPALSTLVLSLVDRRGEPVEGFLRSHDVYNLELPADLVVLAGCETALGKEVRGEGLIGLTRGFMYAGASRVLVSLWKVSDEGTAELMPALYRNLLEEDLTPAAALRQAQLEMRARWPHPFHWAGFVMQGDWRPPRPDK